MPALVLGMYLTAFEVRLMRASMLEVGEQDFVTTARSKGLGETAIAYRHVLRNAMLPLVTMLGLQIGAMLGGSVLVETVFAWPGLGRLAYTAVFQRDINLLLGLLFMCSLMVIITNIVTEVGHHAPGYYSAMFLDGSLEEMGIYTVDDMMARFRELFPEHAG